MATFDALELLLSAKYIGAPAFRQMSADVEGLVSSTSGLSRAGAAFSALGTVTLAAGVAMAAGMAKAVTVAAAYDDAIQRIIAVNGIQVNSVLTAKDAHDQMTASLINHRTQLQALNAEIAAAATTYGMNPTDVAKGAYFIFSALPALKISSAQALGNNVINQLAAYSRASGPTGQGGVSFGQAAQDLPRLFSGYNTPIGNWGGAAGVLTFLENSAHMTQQQLVMSMTRFMPAATALGIPFTDSATLMAALASSGVVGTRAGTEASSGLISFFGNSKMDQAGLKKLGMDPSKFFGKDGQLIAPDQMFLEYAKQLSKLNHPDQLAALHDTFGLVGFRAYGGLLETGMEKYGNLIGDEKKLGIYNNPAQAQRYMLATAGGMMQSPGAKFQSLLAALELLGVVVGNRLMPYVMKAEDALTKLALAMASVVANSHSLKDLILNSLGAIFSGGKQTSGATFGSIGAGLMGYAGGHMTFPAGGGVLLGTLGALFGSGIGFKGLGMGLGALGKIDQGIMGKHEAGTKSAGESMLKWLNGTASGNQNFDALVAQDFAKKNEAFKKASIKYVEDRKNISETMARRLRALEDETNLKELGITKLKSGNLSYSMKPEHVARRNQYEDAHNTILRKGQAELMALGKKPQKGDFLTPFDGSFGAMPLKPGEFHGPKNLLDAIFTHSAAFSHGVVGAMGAGGRKVGGMGAGILEHLGKPSGMIGPDLGGAFKSLVSGLKSIPMGLVEKIKAIPGMFLSMGKNILGAVPALGGFVAAAAPIAAIILAIIAVVMTIIALFTRFRSQGQQLTSFFAGIFGPALQAVFKLVGGAVKQLKATWDQTMNSPAMKDAMNKLVAGFKSAAPMFQFFAKVFVAVAGIIIGIIANVIGAVIKMLPTFINIFTAILGIVSGVFKLIATIVMGVIHIVVAMIHGQWGAIPGIVKGIFGNILGILGGIKDSILSLFGNLIGLVLGLIGGFVGGLIAWFKHLWDVLVGHSIIPDMVNGIIHWFQQLPGRVIGMIAGFVGTILGNIGHLKDLALNYLGNLALMGIAKFQQLKDQAIAFIVNLAAQGVAKFNDFKSGILNLLTDLPGKLATIGTEMIQRFIGAVGNMAGAAAGAVRNVVQGAANGAAGILHAAHIPGFASGGTVPYGMLAMVGERGPELMALPGGAHIFNHSETFRLTGGLHHQQDPLRGVALHVPRDFYTQMRDAVAQGHQQGLSGNSPRQNTMAQARQIQSLREDLAGLYDRRSGMDAQYRYAVQYTQ